LLADNAFQIHRNDLLKQQMAIVFYMVEIWRALPAVSSAFYRFNPAGLLTTAVRPGFI
jgi:hypothetical protein